jgi:protein ImuA
MLLAIITNVRKILETLALNTTKNIVARLQKDIILLEGHKPLSAKQHHIAGLENIEAAFPNNVFPTGVIHEFLSFEPEHIAASAGFIGGILNALTKEGGICLWVSSMRRLFPVALKMFGLEPDRIIFIDVQREKDVLWATEEALKCKGIAAVIAEIRELTFMQSRRLQLAVETSKVTGFVIRTDPQRLCTTACMSRWQIISKPSVLEEGMPGVGFPRWQVELQKMRSGWPGKWIVEWSASRFKIIEESKFTIRISKQVKIAG